MVNFNARWFYDSVMFMQPALTGLDRAFRGFTEQENRKVVAFKGAMIAAVSSTIVLNSLLNFKDEYDALEEWEKAAYLHLFWRNPVTGEVNGIKFPKLYEIAVIMNIGEGLVETYYNIAFEAKDATEASKEFAKGALKTISSLFTTIPITPYTARPIIEQLSNEDKYTKAPILSQTELNLPSGAQSKIGQSIALEKFTDLLEDIGVPQEGFEVFTSTPRFEKLIKQMFNTAGEVTLNLLDNAYLTANPEEDDKPRKSLTENLFGTWRYVPKDRKFSKHQTEFYESLENMNVGQNEMRKYINTNDLEKLEKAIIKYGEKGIGVPGFAPTLQDQIRVITNKEATKIRDTIKQVYYNKDLSVEMKTELMNSLYEKLNDLFEDAAESIKNLDKANKSNY